VISAVGADVGGDVAAPDGCAGFCRKVIPSRTMIATIRMIMESVFILVDVNMLTILIS